MDTNELIKQIAKSWHYEKKIPEDLLGEFLKIPHDERMKLLGDELNQNMDEIQEEHIEEELSEAKERIKLIRKGIDEIHEKLKDFQNVYKKP